MRYPKTALLAIMALSSAIVSAQDIKLNMEPTPAPTFTDEQAIEAFGWFLARNTGLIALGFTEKEVATLSRGMAKAVTGEKLPYEIEQIGPSIQALIGKRQDAALAKMREHGLQESAKFMTEIRTKPGVVSLPNGSAYEVVSAGTGPKPREDQMVKVNYTGRLISGDVFDSSEPGVPVEFVLDSVIPGWREGLVHVNQGSKVMLYIPPHLAYGDSGSPEIPPSSTLIFEVELLEVRDAPAETLPPAPED